MSIDNSPLWNTMFMIPALSLRFNASNWSIFAALYKLPVFDRTVLPYRGGRWIQENLFPQSFLVDFSKHSPFIVCNTILRLTLTLRLMETVSCSALWMCLINCFVSSGTEIVEYIRTFNGIWESKYWPGIIMELWRPEAASCSCLSREVWRQQFSFDWLQFSAWTGSCFAWTVGRSLFPPRSCTRLPSVSPPGPGSSSRG